MKKDGKGRPPHEPNEATRAQVSALVSFGIVIGDVASYIGVCEETLRKYYKDEIEKSKIERIGKVGNFLFHAASGSAIEDGASYGDCLRASMFYLKTQAGWREKADSTIEISGDSSKSVKVEFIGAI